MQVIIKFWGLYNFKTIAFICKYTLVHFVTTCLIFSCFLTATMELYQSIAKQYQVIQGEMKEHEQAMKERDQATNERDQAMKERDDAMKDQDEAMNEIDRATKERDQIMKEQDQVMKERYQAIVERDQVKKLNIQKVMEIEKEREQSIKERDLAVKECHQTIKEHDDTIRELNEKLSKCSTFWIVPRHHVTVLEKVIGGGAWGYVKEGRFRDQQVAVKCVHEQILNKQTMQRVYREICTMSQVNHSNLVLFIAAVLDDQGGPMIITELLDTHLQWQTTEK